MESVVTGGTRISIPLLYDAYHGIMCRQLLANRHGSVSRAVIDHHHLVVEMMSALSDNTRQRLGDITFSVVGWYDNRQCHFTGIFVHSSNISVVSLSRVHGSGPTTILSLAVFK